MLFEAMDNAVSARTPQGVAAAAADGTVDSVGGPAVSIASAVVLILTGLEDGCSIRMQSNVHITDLKGAFEKMP